MTRTLLALAMAALLLTMPYAASAQDPPLTSSPGWRTSTEAPPPRER